MLVDTRYSIILIVDLPSPLSCLMVSRLMGVLHISEAPPKASSGPIFISQINGYHSSRGPDLGRDSLWLQFRRPASSGLTRS
jgi:hypothetical protein